MLSPKRKHKLRCPVCGARKIGLEEHIRVKHGATALSMLPSVKTITCPKPTGYRPKGESAGVEPMYVDIYHRRMRCPDCDGVLVSRHGPWGHYYGCEDYPECKGKIGSHPNGVPVGIPANQNTRKIRMATHAIFDPLWQAGPRQQFKTKDIGYAWMAGVLGLTTDQAHIAMFDTEMCKKFIEIIWDTFGD